MHPWTALFLVARDQHGAVTRTPAAEVRIPPSPCRSARKAGVLHPPRIGWYRFDHDWPGFLRDIDAALDRARVTLDLR